MISINAIRKLLPSHFDHRSHAGQTESEIAPFGYYDIKSLKVTESCYEIDGANKESKLVEVYFNPITGDIVPSAVPVAPGAK